jgi:hypothetical protein
LYLLLWDQEGTYAFLLKVAFNKVQNIDGFHFLPKITQKATKRAQNTWKIAIFIILIPFLIFGYGDHKTSKNRKNVQELKNYSNNSQDRNLPILTFCHSLLEYSLMKSLLKSVVSQFLVQIFTQLIQICMAAVFHIVFIEAMYNLYWA